MEFFSEKGLLELAEGIDSLTITIKANENFIDILKRVSEEAEKKCPDVSQKMSDNEIVKSMETCFNNVDCGKKEKKKKNKKFKVGDVVYLGSLQGQVVLFNKQYEEIKVNFGSLPFEPFTDEGRVFNNAPIVLSHFPYELKMKKIK